LLEDPVSALQRVCAAAGVVVTQHVLDAIPQNQDLAVRLPMCRTDAQFLAFYKDASNRLGISTKQAVIAVDKNRNIVIDGLFLAKSSSSDFYYAYEDGKPYLLKLTKEVTGHDALKREAATYQRVFFAAQEKNAAPALKNALKHLVPVELIELSDPRGKESERAVIYALKMPVFVGTLEECPSDPRLSHLYCNAGDAVFMAMTALHAVGLVHCDIKPGNIFINSDGICMLGDYDAVVPVNEPVFRSTPAFLPEYFRSRFLQRTQNGTHLMATPAIDYAMLACTLLSGLGVKDFSNLRPSVQSVSASRDRQKKQLGKDHWLFDKITEQLEVCVQVVEKAEKETLKALVTPTGLAV
jgi:serine/threonine protein kinase